MPSKSTDTFSITYSPDKDIDGPTFGTLYTAYDKIWDFFKNAKIRGRVIEKGTHFHVGVQLAEATEGRYLTSKLKTLLGTKNWSEDNHKKALKVKSHDNIKGLIGGYFTKEPDARMEQEGLIPEELEVGRKTRDDAVAAKSRRDISLDTFCRKLAETLVTISHVPSNQSANYKGADINLAVEALVTEGYRFAKHIKPAWSGNFCAYISALARAHHLAETAGEEADSSGVDIPVD